MSSRKGLERAAAKVDAALVAQGVQLTIGGEPTYVPVDPEGAEWSVAALGPTKLRYAWALADALQAETMPRALAIYSPGKKYPGETNPRWTINMLWRRDGAPLTNTLRRDFPGVPSPRALERFRSALLRALRLKTGWLRAVDADEPTREVWALPLDHDGERFQSVDWDLGAELELLRAHGPAGLRLPLDLVAGEVSRRALTIEVTEGKFHVFLPPLLQQPFVELLESVGRAAERARSGPVVLEGYVPYDSDNVWSTLGIAADPGVLEINLPPCSTVQAYDGWLTALESACTRAGLRSFKRNSAGEESGTGGGNHLLFGGPTLDTNPLLTRPAWIASMLRYWQHHPSLSYLFTGNYVGASSQAPRPDESSRALYDLELAYQFLEGLPPGDHRHLIGETLRHLHTDTSGNTHRSETSFDKFWNVAFDGGCRGLIEFRALESLPHAAWMSAVALLWRALAAWLLANPFRKPLIEHRERLHDTFFLPWHLWADFKTVLRDLNGGGFALPSEVYRAIVDWRFPVLLEHRSGEARLVVRKAHESWPLLCEQPLEGGSTSRFVDASIQRLEFVADRNFIESAQVFVQGRRLPLRRFTQEEWGIGLRYRRSALYPSLHPGIPPHMPLVVTVKCGDKQWLYELQGDRRTFELRRSGSGPRIRRGACRKLRRDMITCDLRLSGGKGVGSEGIEPPTNSV